jgi:transcriptional regulator with XRE-family HTH domain
MGPPDHDIPGRGATLSRILKALRRLRGMRPIDVANAMRMKLRSYEYFESGRARLNVDRVHQVAKVLNADPYAILAAIDIGSPAFALRTIDNKMGTLWLMALLEFDATAQDDIARLAPSVLIAGFTKMFDELLYLARERDLSAEDWMSDKALHAPPANPEIQDPVDGERHGPEKPGTPRTGDHHDEGRRSSGEAEP